MTTASISGSSLQSSPETSDVAPATFGNTTLQVGIIMAASIIGQFKMWFHLQPRAFYEICHCYHRQCGEERSLHLLRSCLAGCVRCLSEVCHHLQCLDGCSLSETLHLKRESIGLWQCFHCRCGHGHPCVQRLAECDQLPQVCSSLLPCQDY